MHIPGLRFSRRDVDRRPGMVGRRRFAQLIRPKPRNCRRTAIVRAVAAAEPTVVNIHGRKTVRGGPGQHGDTYRHVNGMGTGVIIDQRGYIITNYHVVEGVERIQATLANGATTTARLIAGDAASDLAVIKIDVKQSLPVAAAGTSSDLMKGETVIALGNAFGYEHTVTRGIISALHRSVQVSESQRYRDLIQTDAAINPGNSGGPLLNIDGDMIGVVVAVRVGAQGIAFAIPIDDALAIAARLISVEERENKQHGVVGGAKIVDGKRKYVVKQDRRRTAPRKKPA